MVSPDRWSSLVVALCAVGLLVVVPFLVLLGFLANIPVFGEVGTAPAAT